MTLEVLRSAQHALPRSAHRGLVPRAPLAVAIEANDARLRREPHVEARRLHTDGGSLTVVQPEDGVLAVCVGRAEEEEAKRLGPPVERESECLCHRRGELTVERRPQLRVFGMIADELLDRARLALGRGCVVEPATCAPEPGAVEGEPADEGRRER